MQIRESLGRDVIRLIFWYPARWLILALPLEWGIGVMRMMGDMHYLAGRGLPGLLRNNLARIKGDSAYGPEGSKTAREYLQMHYVDRLSILLFPRMGAREVERLIEFEGLERLKAGLDKGKGVVLVHGHFGPALVPLVALARLGFPMKQVGFPSDEGLSWIGRNVAFRLRMKYEAMMPAQVVMADAFMRPVFKWLSGNGVIMITGDGSGTEKKLGKQETLTFHGQPVMFPLGPAILAAKTGAELIPMFITPGEKKPFKIVMEDPIRIEGNGDETFSAAMKNFARLLEQYTARYPAYMRFLDRFSPGALIEEPDR
ncbi:MAG: lysophospholipid acyltransferase family protein [Nitrospinae bacterium]|nr:lysophospholipid acyltransferase family protein [Nitrospinota bacterium]